MQRESTTVLILLLALLCKRPDVANFSAFVALSSAYMAFVELAAAARRLRNDVAVSGSGDRGSCSATSSIP